MLSDSDINSEAGSHEYFEQFEKRFRSLFPRFKSIKGATSQQGHDVLFDRIPSAWMGTGHREIIAMLGELLQCSHQIIAIEEPERGVHPGLVAPLIETLRSIHPDRRFVFTTHSPAVLATAQMEDVFQLDDEFRLSPVDESSVGPLARRLGVRPSDVLDHHVLLFVEGPYDKGAWEEWLKAEKMEVYIGVVDMGGFGNVKYYANADVLFLRRNPPPTCIALDGDVVGKVGGSKAIGHARSLAEKTNGKLIELESETLEDYLLCASAIATTLGSTEIKVKQMIELVKREHENRDQPPAGAKAKWILDRVLLELRGTGYRERDARSIAANIPKDAWNEDIKKTIKTLREILNRK